MSSEALQSFAYEIRRDSAVIWRCFSHDTKAVIPEVLEGYPVTELAPYAFSAHMDEKQLLDGVKRGRIRIYVPQELGGKGDGGCNGVPGTAGAQTEIQLPEFPQLCGERLEQILLPVSLRSVGRYCFYNCSRLRCIEFGGALSDWGTGVFTGCHKVGRLCVYPDAAQDSSLKEVLDELPEEIGAELRDCESGEIKAQLVFPEFYEEGVENTPARILETHVHGTGMRYRNCFQGKKFDCHQYDLLFPHAVVQEHAGACARMAAGRLRYPLGLSQAAREQYESYVWEHGCEIADFLLEEGDFEGVRWLAELFDRPEVKENRLLPYMIERASRLQAAEILSELVNRSRTRTVRSRKRLEL